MKIRSVAILGAGAVGSYFVYGLADRRDIDFCVVADGERKARLERDGITIDDKKEVRTFYPAIKSPHEARGVDLLLVAVKYTGLEAALEDIRTIAAPETAAAPGTDPALSPAAAPGTDPALSPAAAPGTTAAGPAAAPGTDPAPDTAAAPGTDPALSPAAAPGTIVLSLLNGIDSEEKIGTVIDPAQIVYSLMRVSSERRNREDGRNVITFDPAIKWGVYLGEKGTPVKSERIAAIQELFAGTTCGVFFVEDIIQDQWAKYASNICYNLPQAVLDLPFGAYFDSEHVAFLRKKLFDEVHEVGAALGIEVLSPALAWDSCAKTARFSTLQDLDAGRHTEIDMFAGVLMEKAKALGISVPYTEYTYHAIKALEEKNDGRFVY